MNSRISAKCLIMGAAAVLGTGAPMAMSAQTASDPASLYENDSRSDRSMGGFFIGVGGGASIPVGELDDDGYDIGWNVTVPIGWQSMNTPLGIRLDLSYDRLNGSTVGVAPARVELSDLNIWSGMLDLTLQFPLGSGRSAFYLMAGGGVHRISSADDGEITFGDSDDATTEPGVNGGAGLSFGFDRARLFIESRFVSVFTEDNNSNYVPVILGVRFQ